MEAKKINSDGIKLEKDLKSIQESLEKVYCEIKFIFSIEKKIIY